MPDFSFNDRISWLAYRSEWRTRYLEAADAIRATKREIANHRAQRRLLGEAGNSHLIAADRLQHGLRYQRDIANDLMIELNEAKEVKDKQIAEARAAIAA